MSLGLEGWHAAERIAVTAAAHARYENGRVEWMQLRNRLRAFGRFLYAEDLIARRARCSLDDALEGVRQLDPYDRVWATEGLGYAHASQIGAADPPLLKRSLPARSLIPLHAGMGLAFAAALLHDSRAGAIRDRISRFVDLCMRHAATGYASVTFEALGLATRGLAPHLMSEVAAEIERLHPNLVAYFWHGVGRGSYFSPLLAATLAPTRDLVVSALAAAPAGEPAANVVAGLAWAVVLVNIRDPDIIDQFVSSCGRDASAVAAMGDGIDRAIHVWATCVGADGRLRALAAWRPNTAADRWERLVAQPAQQGLLGRGRAEQPARWFRYRPAGAAAAAWMSV
jgi:hypothetical protein